MSRAPRATCHSTGVSAVKKQKQKCQQIPHSKGAKEHEVQRCVVSTTTTILAEGNVTCTTFRCTVTRSHRRLRATAVTRRSIFRVFPQLSYAAPESLRVSYVACAFSSKFRNSILSPNEQVRAVRKTIKIALKIKALKNIKSINWKINPMGRPI